MRSKLRAWFLLFRPWSYTATIVPFLVVAAWTRRQAPASFGGGEPFFSWGRWWLALAAALPLQAACNLLNTWGDERSGVDSVPGAVRTTPQVHDGIVSLRAVFAAAVACVLLSAALALPLFRIPAHSFAGCAMDASFNAPLLVVALIGLFGACNYATGVKFKYHGLGVPFVFFLMGAVEMAGVYYSATLGACRPLEIVRDPLAWLLALPVCCLVAVIMHGNDMRDMPTDRAAGIRTLALILGSKGALAFYLAMHVLPYLVAAAWTASAVRGCVSAGAPFRWATLLPFAVLPLSFKTLRRAVLVYRSNPACPPWRGLERASGGVHFLFGAAYSLSLL